ncbi:hypothetical protein [Methanobrevibacter sp.]|uniref:hypothetical protein n=1 Tax=Methanobrevibacter sp. TaxID=66852 RepID=UPI00388E85D7
MIKHGVVMVTLLILTLSLLGVVSASDEITASDVDTQLSLNHENAQVEVTNDELMSAGNAESSDFGDIGSLSGNIEGDNPIYLNSENVVEIENKALDSGIDMGHSDLIIDAGVESDIFVSDVELLDNGEENNISVSMDALSVVIDSDLSDDDYKFGQEITISANELSDFESADEIMVVAEVGEDEIDNVTVENVLNGINDASNGYITYRKGNLVKLSSIESGLKNIAFFIKKGEFLTMVFYKTGDMTPIYSDNVVPQDSVGLWMKSEELLYFNGASSGAKSLSDGLSKDVLSSGNNGYHDFADITLEQAMIQTLLEYDLNDDTDLPLDSTGKCVIGVSGDSDDNAFIWYAPDKSAYLGVDSNDNNMIGFNLEDNTFQSRMITVMSYDQSNLKEMLENSLNPEESVMNGTFNGAGEITPEAIKQIGVDAGNSALSYFDSQGIDVNKYYRNFYILTSAGNVKINGLDTRSAIDGIIEVFGNKISENLISINSPLWKDLVFYFLWVNSPNSDDITSYGLRYESATGNLIESGEVKRQGDAIAYALGLYGKHPSPTPKHPTHYTKKISNSYVASQLTSMGDKLTNNTTNMTNKTNATGLNLSDVKKSVPKVNNTPTTGKGSPYNILYNVAAICIIFIIFGASYSKR